MVAGTGHFRSMHVPILLQCCLDPLGHHAVTYRDEEDVVIRHNRLQEEIFDLCHRAHLSAPSVIMEVGVYSGVAARAAEFKKHSENDTRCAQLSWKCTGGR